MHKPAGLTSFDIVKCVRYVTGRTIKVGHAGTLDPAATGVLPIALGQATRLIEYLADVHKGYRATICLGLTTTTDDAEGEVLVQRPIADVQALIQDGGRAVFSSILDQFRGTIMQVPPMYAAIHHQGKRLYELARRGHIVERLPRPITIERLTLVDDVSYGEQHGFPVLYIELDIACRKGTYIRALARDIGETLGCGGHLKALQRTFVGPFTLENSLPLSALPDQADMVKPMLLPPETAILHIPMVVVDSIQIHRICRGLEIDLAESDGDLVRAHDQQGQLVALLRHQEHHWHPEKVFLTVSSVHNG